MDQRFIEHDLPLAEISEQSAGEKNIHIGLPPQVHVWWARRPLSPSRAITLAALLDDPGPHNPERRRQIKKLISEVSHRKAAKDRNTREIKEARKLIREHSDDEAPKILDPFSGGGSIPLESLRLGCEAYASDYNPVAVLVEKATIEWPHEFGINANIKNEESRDGKGLGFKGKQYNVLAYLVKKWGNRLLDNAEDEIGKYYPKETGEGLVGSREVDANQSGWTPVGYIWARTIDCQNPTCSAEVPLIKQYWLCKKDGKNIAYKPIIDDISEDINFKILEGEKLKEEIDNGFDPSNGTISRGNASCPICGHVTESKKIREISRKGHMGQRMVAVVLRHEEEVGKKYRLAKEKDRNQFRKAENYLDKKLEKWEHKENPLPEESIMDVKGRVNIYRYEFEKWKSIFNPRQKLALVTLLEITKEKKEEVYEDCKSVAENTDKDIDPDGLSEAVIGSLGVLLDRLVSYSSTFTRWVKRTEIAAQIYSRQAIPMLWDYVELNMFSGSSGSLETQIKYFLAYIDGSASNLPVGDAHVSMDSSTDLKYPDGHFDAILTDPPYYDNVPYGALSDFFYVWLKRSVGDQFPDLFSTPTAPKTDEIIQASHLSEAFEEKDKDYFERLLTESFRESHRVLKENGIAVFIYAHKTTEGWESMLNALVDAGFVVTGSWPVHTERKSRLLAAQTAALASSIYMVCRKTEREELGFWNDIQPQIKDRVEEKLEQFWEADVIRGGDFFISAIGPGMEAYSRYDRVETYSGEKVSVSDLLQYIRGVATDFLVRQLLRNVSSGSVDKEGQFYLTYRWTFRDTRVEYDDALRIAKAEGVNIDRIAERDSFIKKTRKYIYVHGPQDRDDIEEVHDMVDAMHLACQMWEDGRGDDQVGKMLAKHGYSQSPSFWQFCQGVSECLPDGNKEKQWLEGMLMSKDKYQQAEAVGDDEDEEGQIQIDFNGSKSG